MARPARNEQQHDPDADSQFGDTAGLDTSSTASRRLLAVNLRPTAVRVLILQAFEIDPDQRITAEAVFKALHDRGTVASLGSIYRVIKLLELHGVLQREWHNGISGGKAVYWLKTRGENTQAHHIVCRECGCGVHVDDAELHERLVRFAAAQGVRVSVQPLTIQMTCAACQAELDVIQRRRPQLWRSQLAKIVGKES